jgi:serine protease Do
VIDLAHVAGELRRVTVELTDAAGQPFGCGVLWPPGWVVTNAHVVRRPHVGVRLLDGHRLEGALVARDAEADLALLRVDGDGIPTAQVAGPDGARVGSLVVAIGHPLGVRGAVTAGIIHAIAPVVPGGPACLLADVRLAPGNSGGPLADAAGRVLGLNAMIVGRLAVAIPMTRVTRFVRAAGVEGV